MKKYLLSSVVMLAALFPSSLPALADTFPTTVIRTIVYVVPGNFEPEPDRDPDNKRKPSRPISCTISQDGGLELGGYAAEFNSYELWDAESDSCMASFSTESDFIDGLFSMPTGEYQIHLVTESYQLIGYIGL